MPSIQIHVKYITICKIINNSYCKQITRQHSCFKTFGSIHRPLWLGRDRPSRTFLSPSL